MGVDTDLHSPVQVHAHASSSIVGVQGWQERSAGTSTSTSTSGRTTVVDDFATDTRPIILYDGVCGLCNGAGTSVTICTSR